MLYLLLAVLAGAVVMVLMDYFRFGMETVKQRQPKYLLALAVGALIAFFIKQPVMQYFILVLCVIGFSRILIGMDKIAGTTPQAGRMAYGASITDKWNTANWFHFMCACAGVAFISWCQVDSYFADSHKLNWLFWAGLIVFGVLAFYGAYRANKSGGSRPTE